MKFHRRSLNSKMHYISSSEERQIIFCILWFTWGTWSEKNIGRGLERLDLCTGAFSTEFPQSPRGRLLHYFRINFFFHMPLISLSMLPSRKHTEQILNAFVLGHCKHGNGKGYIVNLHLTITLLQQCWPVLFDPYLHSLLISQMF